MAPTEPLRVIAPLPPEPFMHGARGTRRAPVPDNSCWSRNPEAWNEPPAPAPAALMCGQLPAPGYSGKREVM